MHVRPTARVLLIDRLDRIFLQFFSLDGGASGVWITPGGGLDGDETYEQAALRELWEEVGLRDVELGPCVWQRSFVVRNVWGPGDFEQRERFFVCRVDSHDASQHVNHDALEAQLTTDERWWTVDEIAASTDRFGPSDMATLLVPILAGEFPAEPITVPR